MTTAPIVTEIDIRSQVATQKLGEFRQAMLAAGVASDQADRAFAENNATYLKLAASTDLAARARLAFEAAERRAGNALDAGKISAEQFGSILDGVANKQAAAIARTNAFGAAVGGAANGARNLSQVAGQAGFQLQDFAVQVQGGTSALTALSQQGSQFLGIFGPTGAVAGAALAIGAIGVSILSTTDAFDVLLGKSKELSEILETSNEFLKQQAERAKQAAEPYELLASNYAKARIELAKLIEAEDKRLARDQARNPGDNGFFDPNQMSSTADPRLDQAVKTEKQADIALAGAVRDETEAGKRARDKQLDEDLKKRADEAERSRAAEQRAAERASADAARDAARQASEAAKEADRIERERLKTEEKIARLQQQSAVEAERQRQAENKREQDFEDYLTLLEREAELAGQTKEIRREELELMEARKKAGRDLTDIEEARVRESVRTKDANEKMRKDAEETSKFIGSSFDRAFDRVGDSLADVAVKGGKAFNDLGKVAAGVAASIYADFLKLSLANPLRNLAQSGFESAGNFFGDLFTPSVNATGGGLGAGGIADDLAFFGAATGGLITGGTPGKDSVPVMAMPGEYIVREAAVNSVGVDFMQALNDNGAGALEAAPGRYSSGASAWGGGGGGGNVVVNIYDNRSSRDTAPASVSERRGSDGSRQIDVLIEDKIDAALAGGRFDPSMQSRYGARKTVKRT